MKKATWIKTTGKFLLASVVIGWLVSTGKIDFKAMKNLLQPQIILVGLLITIANVGFSSERWLLLLRSQNIEIQRWMALKLTLIGLFFNFVVPGGVGGDLVKGFYASSHTPHAKLATAVSVAMDRLVGLYTILIMALIALISDWPTVQQHPQIFIVFVGLLIISIIFSLAWAIVLSRKSAQARWLQIFFTKIPKGHHFKNLFISFNSYAHHKSVFFRAIGYSLIGQTFAILFFSTMGQFLHYSIPLSAYFFAVPVGFMVTAVPISPAGVGVGQAAFYYLFNEYTGVTTSVGSVTVTAMQLFQFSLGLVGAAYYVGLSRKMTSPQTQEVTSL